MNLEDRLRRALRREEPAEDFAERVLARLERPAPSARSSRWALAASVLLAFAVAALVGRNAWLTHTHRLETEQFQARNEAASRQLAYALDLTSRELESVHQHLKPRIEETGS